MIKYIPAVLFAGLLVAATIFVAGCTESAPYPEGLKGAACDYPSQCISNSCVYPGVCE